MSVNQDSHTVGEWIREHCLQPRALTVGAAADLLGIARPTLSKILNARMELSAAVAARMETVFAVDAKALLEKQLQTSDSQAQTAAVSAEVRRYVPRFLEVRAGDLVRWADTLDARARLSVLLRRLVHSTGTALRTVDFPGNDDSQRPGWDGWVETNVGNPWIPEGKSGCGNSAPLKKSVKKQTTISKRASNSIPNPNGKLSSSSLSRPSVGLVKTLGSRK